MLNFYNYYHSQTPRLYYFFSGLYFSNRVKQSFVVVVVSDVERRTWRFKKDDMRGRSPPFSKPYPHNNTHPTTTTTNTTPPFYIMNVVTSSSTSSTPTYNVEKRSTTQSTNSVVEPSVNHPPSIVNFYTTIPNYELTLDEFELYALKRLRVRYSYYVAVCC